VRLDDLRSHGGFYGFFFPLGLGLFRYALKEKLWLSIKFRKPYVKHSSTYFSCLTLCSVVFHII